MTRPDHGEALFRTIYVSRASPGVLASFDDAVDDIVEFAQPNNERRGLTGLLLAHHGWFVQALEGPRRQVGLVVAAIMRDPRHGQIETLIASPVEARAFERWSLCARRLTPDAAPVLADLELNRDFDPFRLDGGRALRLLGGLGRLTDEAAPRDRSLTGRAPAALESARRMGQACLIGRSTSLRRPLSATW